METNDKFVHRKFKAGILRKRRTKVCNINITELLKTYKSDGIELNWIRTHDSCSFSTELIVKTSWSPLLKKLLIMSLEYTEPELLFVTSSTEYSFGYVYRQTGWLIGMPETFLQSLGDNLHDLKAVIGAEDQGTFRHFLSILLENNKIQQGKMDLSF